MRTARGDPGDRDRFRSDIPGKTRLLCHRIIPVPRARSRHACDRDRFPVVDVPVRERSDRRAADHDRIYRIKFSVTRVANANSFSCLEGRRSAERGSGASIINLGARRRSRDRDRFRSDIPGKTRLLCHRIIPVPRARSRHACDRDRFPVVDVPVRERSDRRAADHDRIYRIKFSVTRVANANSFSCLEGRRSAERGSGASIINLGARRRSRDRDRFRSDIRR